MKYPSRAKPLGMSSQVTEISNVKCVTRLPKETKRQAVAIIFTDDSARTFTCDSGEASGWQAPTGLLGLVTVVQAVDNRAGPILAGRVGGCVPGGVDPQTKAGRQVRPCPPCKVQWFKPRQTGWAAGGSALAEL